MGNISRKGWTNGWEPNSDPIGGNPNGLLRMDNLTLDQDGAISLARGTAVISSPTLPGYINKLYSRVTAGTNLGAWAPSQAKLRYISTGGNVYRNYDPAGQSLTNFGVPVITGASDTTSAAFGTMYGQNIVCCGTTNVKDAGANQYPLTIPANLAPGVSVGSPLIIDAESGTYSSWVAISGGVVHNASSVGLAPDSTNPTTGGRQGEIQYPANSSSVTIDTTNFNSITLTDNPLDVFNFVVEGSAISYCQSITIRFLLQTPQAVGATQAVTDWYEVTFGLELAACSNTDWNTLTCDRQDFLRIGTTAGVYWNAIKGIQIILEAGHQGSGINIGNLNFCRQLTGSYSYYQVDVRRDTNYLEIGLPSPVSGPYTLSAGLATVTMHAPNAHATEIWLFRINSSGGAAD